MNVSGGGVTQTIISGLELLTLYSVEVAAVNSAGVGLYSDGITAETQDSKILLFKFVANISVIIQNICHIRRRVPQSKWSKYPQPWLCGDQ